MPTFDETLNAIF